MGTELATSEIAMLLLGLIGISALAGVLAGLLGVGGGIVIVPALFWLFTIVDFDPHLAMHIAVASSLATIITTSISSSAAHYRRGAVDIHLIKRWSIGMAFGALAGGLGAQYVEPSTLKAIFGIVAFAVAINLATPKNLIIADSLPENKAIEISISVAIGLFSSLMGIGGGTLAVPTLTSFSYPIHRAIGTASAFGLVISVPATIGFIVSGWEVSGRPPFSLGYVNVIAVAIILPFATFFAPYGARIAHRINSVWVKRIFAAFLVITSVKMLASAL